MLNLIKRTIVPAFLLFPDKKDDKEQKYRPSPWFSKLRPHLFFTSKDNHKQSTVHPVLTNIL
jgi:hypothetical protein